MSQTTTTFTDSRTKYDNEIIGAGRSNETTSQDLPLKQFEVKEKKDNECTRKYECKCRLEAELHFHSGS